MPISLAAKERKVLSVVLHDSQQSASEIARKTGLHSHNVVYVLKKLRERGVIRPYLLTNPHALGLTDYCIFFNLSGEERQARSKVIEYCESSPQVAYFAELSGAYQYSVSLFCRTIFEVTDFFTALGRILPRASFDMSFAVRARWTEFHGKWFEPRGKTQIRDRGAVPESENEIDDLDRKILSIYSAHAGLALPHIAAKLGISESGLRYRMYGLMKRQIVLGIPYHLDRAAAGNITFRIMVSAKGLDPSFHDELFDFTFRHRSSTGFVRCVGSWDFELTFDVEQPKDFGAIVEEVHDRFGAHIRETQTVTEMVVHKAHFFPSKAGLRSDPAPAARSA